MFQKFFTEEPGRKAVILFLLVVLGILANWFWSIGWEYLSDPSAGLSFGPTLTILVRIILAFIAAALTFVPIYNKIGQTSEESWVPYFLAFQNGFFWEAALDAVIRTI
jgi:hypothetical protein